MNIILDADSYKHSHFLQYPENAQYISSYIEARDEDVDIVFFGLQTLLMKWEANPVTSQVIEEAASYLDPHGVPWNREGWEYIRTQHAGKLPLSIEAVPEGTVVRGKNVLVQVTNTDPQCAWLVSFVETALLRAVWYPSSVATLSRECKKVILKYMEETSESVSGVEFKLHDFGARGATCEEAAGLGAAAHLINFKGTDTLSGLRVAREVYGEHCAGFSIPAAEHSTITSWGKPGEVDAYRNMIRQFGGQGKIFAVVSDSYDLEYAVRHLWGEELKKEVISNGGTLVVRPDSGDPVSIVRDTILALMDAFGCEFNSKGFKVLPPFLRVIQGDGINRDSIEAILAEMTRHRLSADNIAFGMGGALLQGVVRDTYKWAMKASAICIQGQWRDVFKDPITDPGKRSKKGVLALVKEDGVWATVRKDELGERFNHLTPVYAGGLVKFSLFPEIRRRAEVL